MSQPNKLPPIRCFEGTAKPHEPFWTFKDSAETGGDPELELYGYISEYSWFEDDVTPAMFKNQLYKVGNGGPITVRINSYGGDVVAASVMRTILTDYPGKVTVQIDGVAASAATVVAISGDIIRIQDTAYFMIHDPMVIFFMAALNIEDLNRLAKGLESVKDGILSAYETKTGISRSRLSNMMTDETWMSAKEAVSLGFVDEIVVPQEKVPAPFQNAAFVNAVRNFKNVPEILLKMPDESSVVEDPVVSRLRAEIQLLV